MYERTPLDPPLQPARLAKFHRGAKPKTAGLTDKKVKGKLKHSERLISDSQYLAAKADEWLLTADAGALEAEGMERTYR